MLDRGCAQRLNMGKLIFKLSVNLPPCGLSYGQATIKDVTTSTVC